MSERLAVITEPSLMELLLQMADQYEKRKYSLRDYLDWAADLKTRTSSPLILMIHADETFIGLDHHHGIEEELIFPVLALRLPEFQDEHPEQHRQIHEGE